MGIGAIIVIAFGVVFFFNAWFAFADWAERSLPEWAAGAFCLAVLVLGIVLWILGI